MLGEHRSMSSPLALPNRWRRTSSCRCGLDSKSAKSCNQVQAMSSLFCQLGSSHRTYLPTITSDIAVAIPRPGLGMRLHVLSFLQARGLDHL